MQIRFNSAYDTFANRQQHLPNRVDATWRAKGQPTSILEGQESVSDLERPWKPASPEEWNPWSTRWVHAEEREKSALKTEGLSSERRIPPKSSWISASQLQLLIANLNKRWATLLIQSIQDKRNSSLGTTARLVVSSRSDVNSGRLRWPPSCFSPWHSLQVSLVTAHIMRKHSQLS